MEDIKEGGPPEEDNVVLGGNIELSGFREIDGGSMIIIRKIVGNCAKKFSTLCGNFEKLHITMKPVHKTEGSEKYEIHAKVIDNGKPITAEETDRNLFIVLDSVLKRVEAEIAK